MKRPLQAVLFDWDGTLLDSAHKSYRCYVEVFAAYGIPFDPQLYRASYSPEWTRTYEALALPRERWPEADQRWMECYRREPSALMPGAREALERLAGRELARGLVTSGGALRVRAELEALDLARFFGAVVCGGEAPRPKPHPDPLHLALRRLGVEPAAAAYVGDSPEDVAMARAAGVLAVGVPGGFPNEEALRASAPDLYAPDLTSALAALLG